jgi:hypothetical protein
MNGITFSGLVQSGAGGLYPLAGKRVTLYAAADGPPNPLGGGTTGENGWVSIQASGAPPGGVLYVTADAGGGVVLMAVLGTDFEGAFVVNELTTVAAAFGMAQFAAGTTLQGPAPGLRIAAGMCANLVPAYSGMPSPVMQSSPNADETIALRSIRALGNLVAACVRGVPDATRTLLALATPPGGDPPADTFQALVGVARNPANNVGEIFQQARLAHVYTPALEPGQQPDAWTLAVKVNDSGDDGFMFGGPANVVFDANGYAWIANNVVQGQPYSAKCIMVLRPDGSPADGTDGEPKSPVSGGGIWGPGWGIDIDPDGSVWVGNYGWGYDDDPPAGGSVTELRADGTPVSGDDGYVDQLDRVQAVRSDGAGNIWMASFGNDQLVCYPGGVEGSAIAVKSGSKPFGVAIADDGSAWVTNGGGLGWPRANPSTVCRYSLDLEGGRLKLEMEVGVGYAVKVVALDSQQHGWIASSGDSKVYRVSPDGTVVGQFDGGGIDTPWGLAVDGEDNVWVANFGKLGPGEVFTTGALSVLAGDTEKNRRAGLNTGDPISPSTGYTLKSAGDPVRLHDGELLYGAGSEPCYDPLMRSTSCVVDQAGNVWVVNNWKPDFGSDFLPKEGNPGGDGIVIFVGLAKPPRRA